MRIVGKLRSQRKETIMGFFDINKQFNLISLMVSSFHFSQVGEEKFGPAGNGMHNMCLLLSCFVVTDGPLQM